MTLTGLPLTAIIILTTIGLFATVGYTLKLAQIVYARIRNGRWPPTSTEIALQFQKQQHHQTIAALTEHHQQVTRALEAQVLRLEKELDAAQDEVHSIFKKITDQRL